MMTECPICRTRMNGPIAGMVAHIGVRHLDVTLLKLSQVTRLLKVDFHTVLVIRKAAIARLLQHEDDNSIFESALKGTQ